MFRKSKRLLIFILIALGIGILNLVPSSAYRGIDSFFCRSLAGTFSKSPGLMRYEDLERLGDCVAYYKRLYTVLKHTEPEKSDVLKTPPK